VVEEVQVLSTHPLLTRAVERILGRVKDVPVRGLPPAANETEALHFSSAPRLFLLDSCSLRSDVGPIAARCRANLPGSRFLALLPPQSPISEQIRLFYWGIDGFLELGRTWQAELPKAIERLMRGQFWVPREVLLAFVGHAKSLLSTQLAQGNFLTAREGQVLQLLLRRLTNKEISSALGISERTAKFHVSNILSKLQLNDRQSLFPEKIGFSLLSPAPRRSTS
jgi:DNA-binding NarL/FixJ family response regulator